MAFKPEIPCGPSLIGKRPNLLAGGGGGGCPVPGTDKEGASEARGGITT